MMSKLSLIIISFLFFSFTNNSFKQNQKQYPRVRQAYMQKEKSIDELLKSKNLTKSNLQIHLRAYKYEQKLEVWAKNKGENEYKLLKTYDVCRISGSFGPKRKQGDGQIPEGFYFIDRFNPNSNYHLSLGLNYPNISDRILGVKNKLGGDIFIHGNCVTIGCLPITDDKIKELYILCVEAKNNGQSKIPVYSFPARLTDKKYDLLKSYYPSDSDKLNLWKDLKTEYDYFSTNKKLRKVRFLSNGRHTFS